MKILLLAISALLFVSCSFWSSEVSDEVATDKVEVSIWVDNQNSSDTPQDDVTEELAEEDIWYEPNVPVSNFWNDIEWASQVKSYMQTLSWSTVKIHGSLYTASGELLADTSVKYWYNIGNSFEEISEFSSDEGGQYYFKTTLENVSEEMFYIETLIGEIISRIYFVPDSFDANVFVKSYENLPSNMYFATVVELEGDIISGVDILADPS